VRPGAPDAPGRAWTGQGEDRQDSRQAGKPDQEGADGKNPTGQHQGEVDTALSGRSIDLIITQPSERHQCR
jgi:hypothetical protein